MNKIKFIIFYIYYVIEEYIIEYKRNDNLRYKNLRKMIYNVESKNFGGYNAINKGGENKGFLAVCYCGHSYLNFGKKITNMKIKEILHSQSLNRNDKFKIHAVGKYQIVRDTLIFLIDKNILDVNDYFTEENQDKAAIYLIERRIKNNDNKKTLKGLKKEWIGLSKYKDKEILKNLDIKG